jgi:hypothetical protein
LRHCHPPMLHTHPPPLPLSPHPLPPRIFWEEMPLPWEEMPIPWEEMPLPPLSYQQHQVNGWNSLPPLQTVLPARCSLPPSVSLFLCVCVCVAASISISISASASASISAYSCISPAALATNLATHATYGATSMILSHHPALHHTTACLCC